MQTFLSVILRKNYQNTKLPVFNKEKTLQLLKFINEYLDWHHYSTQSSKQTKNNTFAICYKERNQAKKNT